MSENEMDRLLEEEEQLHKRMEELKARRAILRAEAEAYEEEEKRERELSKPVTIKCLFVSSGVLHIESDYRKDLLELYHRTPGRQWNGTRNMMPVDSAEDFLREAQLLPNITLKFQTGCREDLDWWLHAPPWLIDVHPSRRHLLAKMGPRGSGKYLLSRIPGADWDDASRSWKLPLSEGWRLYKTFEKTEGVAYTEDAQAIIIQQVDKRTKLDMVAKMLDSDDPRLNVLVKMVYVPRLRKEVPFRDALLAFQRVGIIFGLDSGGRILIGDDTGLGKTWQALGICEVWRLTDTPTLQVICNVKAANIPNWQREIERLTGIEPVVCQGGKPDFFTIQQVVMKRHPYVIISHDTLGLYTYAEEDEGKEDPEEVYTWANIFKASNPDVLITDEAHKIKNPDAHRSRAARQLARIPKIILATASPVLNRTEELWPLLYMLDPDVFKVHDQFINTYTFNGRTPRNTEELHDLLRPMFIRRKKSEVQKDLPPINRITRYHTLSSKAKRVYEKVLQGIYEELEHFSPSGEAGREFSVVSILAQITRLKQVCASDCVETTVDQAMSLIDESEDPNSKVLIFSQFKGTALGIARALGSEAVCTVKRTEAGFVSLNATQRDDLFEEARHDPRVRYIVTTEAANEGHNLEFCNWVIFNDLFWTPAGHNQCEGRAYGRLSDPHAIDSFYIVADVDIVKWIMDLLDKKLVIIQQAVDNIEATRDVTGSIGMELIRKMKEQMWRGR